LTRTETLSNLQQNQTQQTGDVVFHSFDPVIVRLFLDSTNVQHEKLVFQLIKPFIEGFSVVGEKQEEGSKEDEAIEASPPSKRKQKEAAKKNPKKRKN
jgi:exosome complex exonuclease DIS3/RRP44